MCTYSLHRVFSHDLDNSVAWYAVSSDMANGKLNDFITNDIFKFFPNEVQTISKEKLCDQHGDRAKAAWFGYRKRDFVVVCTMFGLLARSLRRNNLEKEEFLASKEFKSAKDFIRKSDFFEIMAGREICAILETPPSTPETSPTHIIQQQQTEAIDQDFLYELRNGMFSSRKKAKRGGRLSKSIQSAIKKIANTTSSEDLGHIFGNGVLFGVEFEKEFVNKTFSTTVEVITRNKGIKEAIDLSLGEQIVAKFIQTFRVKDWQQLYVKLATKLPDNSWQTVMNFLNAGRTGVSISY